MLMNIAPSAIEPAAAVGYAEPGWAPCPAAAPASPRTATPGAPWSAGVSGSAARYGDGILEVTVPITEPAETRTILITGK